MLKKSLFLSLVLCTFCVLQAKCQKRKQIEYSGFYDSYYYRGPLNIHFGFVSATLTNSLQINSPRFNLGGSYKVWPRTYFGVDLNYMKINYMRDVAPPKGSRLGLLYIYEFTTFCRLNLLDRKILFKNDINKRPQRIRPFIMLGFGVLYRDDVLSLQNVVKSTNGTNGSFACVLPASFGFAFYLSKRFSILTELGYRYSFGFFGGNEGFLANNDNSYITASFKIQYSILPFKKRRAKYVPPKEGSGFNGGGGGAHQAPIKKDSTLNDPILPPGTPEPAKDDLNAPIPAPGAGEGQTTPADQPKELTEEEKRKQQDELEQKQWEESMKAPKKQPADKKKKEEEELKW